MTSQDIEPEIVAEKPLEKTPQATDPVVVNGYISRSDGKNTVWVNNRPIVEKTTSQTVKVEKLSTDKGQVKIVLTDKKKAASLRPGQVYDPNSNKVYNNLRDVPRVEPKEEPESLVDKMNGKLNEAVDEVHKKAAEFIDLLKPKPDTAESAKK